MGNFVQTYLVEEGKSDLVRDRDVVRECVVQPEWLHHIAWRWRAEGKWANCP